MGIKTGQNFRKKGLIKMQLSEKHLPGVEIKIKMNYQFLLNILPEMFLINIFQKKKRDTGTLISDGGSILIHLQNL